MLRKANSGDLVKRRYPPHRVMRMCEFNVFIRRNPEHNALTTVHELPE